MSARPSLEEHIRQLEEQLLRPEIRRSGAALSALLAEEFVEFASDGAAYTKAQVIAALEREAPHSRSLADFRLSSLAEDVVLATYHATRCNEVSGEVVESLRSSLLVQRHGGWQLLFHQGTLVAS